MDKWIIIPENPLVSFRLPKSNVVGNLNTSYIDTESYTISLVSRIQAFWEIQRQLKKRPIDRWIPKTPAQKDFVYMLYTDAIAYNKIMSIGSGSTAFSLSYPLTKGTKILVSNDREETNQFLKDNKSKLLVNSEGNAVSILMNLNLKWKGISRKTKLPKNIQGFKLLNEFDIYESRPYPWQHLIRIYTTDPKISVYIKMMDTAPQYSEEDPYYNIKNIISERRERKFFRKITRQFSGLLIPSFDYNYIEKTEHLNDLCIPIRKTEDLRKKFLRDVVYQGAYSADSYCISEVKQETRFKIDEMGISKSDTTTGVYNVSKPKKWVYDGSSGGWLESFSQQEDKVVDKNFMLWVENDYVKFPVFVGYFNKNLWEK